MAEEISSPLLSLIKEQGLIDDLQYEEVVAELKRSGAPVIQVLQDFGIMKLDDILHVMATNLGTEVVSLRDRRISPELVQTIPAKVARMYHCLPVAMKDGDGAGGAGRPARPGAGRRNSILPSKRDVQMVVADPAEIEKAIDRLYGQEESESFAEILKELGADADIAREVERGRRDDDEQRMTEPGQRGAHREIRQPGACNRPFRTARATFISSRSRRNSASATAWTARFTKWRRRPNTWRCR